MIRRVVSLIMLVAFVGQVFGCSSNLYLTIDEAKKKYGLREPRKGEIIAGVVLSSGEEITFDSAGGVYNEMTKSIDGYTSNNKAFTTALNNTGFIKVIHSSQNESVMYAIEPWAFEGDQKQQYYDGIKSVVTHSGGFIPFDEHGGRLCMKKGAVTGKTKDGTPVEAKFDDVKSIRVREADASKTAITIGAIGIGVMTAVICISVILWAEG